MVVLQQQLQQQQHHAESLLPGWPSFHHGLMGPEVVVGVRAVPGVEDPDPAGVVWGYLRTESEACLDSAPVADLLVLDLAVAA